MFMLLQIVPTPTGQMPTAEQFTTQLTGNFQTDLNTILNAMRAQGYTQLAAQFQTFALHFHSANPQYNAEQVLSVYLGESLSGAIATGASQSGATLGQLPGAAAKGAANAIETLGGFNLGSWFIRIGEILLGLVLIGVGVARITGAQNAISKIVKAKVPI